MTFYTDDKIHKCVLWNNGSENKKMNRLISSNDKISPDAFGKKGTRKQN